MNIPDRQEEKIQINAYKSSWPLHDVTDFCKNAEYTFMVCSLLPTNPNQCVQFHCILTASYQPVSTVSLYSHCFLPVSVYSFIVFLLLPTNQCVQFHGILAAYFQPVCTVSLYSHCFLQISGTV